ncbi:UDP-N-acetylglucosamine 4-epimerase [Zhongshania aliphaticivorans]|uniref:UDP-N-acetylglucosamine 4-epimerase n=1 Tax=Zhongshania aliphaticivorans TaxID=1470434 RepID=A0A5S9QA88_9GAMM|nr:NAD-dependent epimerase [Zhongshania aliphaticivorans]CAA0102476.1 UDP-N-acetylglucosamine 4-epimerase [Zhongshania aliphaticivorans]CAA0114207.1 UDP-N-acetylglucosamine 4-epimerase [Zhongshania aliphaticivorans]
MKYLITGNAGFIGFHVAKTLLARGDSVVGIDNVNDYYDTSLKEARLRELEKVAQQGFEEGAKPEYEFIRASIADKPALDACFGRHQFDRVINLAAQAGVRYSIEHPEAYVESNLIGFANLLEACRNAKTPHLTYASTSSVYGGNTTMPFSEDHSADHPLQFYAATKRANELMAHSYSHLFKLPTTGLRFFTVYGPWGRPDMALFKFTSLILQGKPIPVFNHGHHSRDFTYIDDIVEGVIKSSDQVADADPNWSPAAPNPATSNAPYRIFNIGNGNPAQLSEYIDALEEALGKKAQREMLPMQAGDIPDTHADTHKLQQATGYKPDTSVREGVQKFVAWYRDYYSV